MNEPLTSKPKCQDGIACGGKNTGFIVLQYLNEKGRHLRSVCYECVKLRQKQKDEILLEMSGKINKVE